MRLVASIAVLVLAIVQTIPAQPVRRYEYLSNAAERMIAVSEATADPTAAAVEGAAAAGCGALGRLLEDPAFRSDVERLSKMPQYARERAELKRDLTLFTSSFMRWEQQTLRDAGLDERSAQSVLWSIAALRDAADRDLRPDDVLSGIKSLRTDLCGAAKEAQSQRTAQERRRTVATWGMRVGGVLVIAANGAFAAPSGGFTIASVAIGGAIVGIGFAR
jgi:hypothetical protein